MTCRGSLSRVGAYFKLPGAPAKYTCICVTITPAKKLPNRFVPFGTNRKMERIDLASMIFTNSYADRKGIEKKEHFIT